MSNSSKDPASLLDCKYFELIQYACNTHTREINCVPFARLFKRCKGKPTIEMDEASVFEELKLQRKARTSKGDQSV
ncbi:hypothetical protein DSO57_1035613 [Entomophthora muscae]|uniref:Uncharacterized protein n=1 Tax=Entomophthora muscae TaxID=34485 RepID=A0ACC2S1M9_9FUNG|nr:hypothetical protein DSO57_1035613 [Entomophthora muscae]